MENNISVKHNFVVINGRQYDLQLNMYVVSHFENFGDVLGSIGKIETVIKLLTLMIKSYLIKAGQEAEADEITENYIAVNIPLADMPEITRAVASALGFEELSESEQAMSDAIDDEFPELKN